MTSKIPTNSPTSGSRPSSTTVPTAWPERISWALDSDYHDTPGGHVRIYRRRDLEQKMERAGLFLRGGHHAHAFHSPLMDPILEPFHELAQTIHFHAPQIPLASNLTGELVTDHPDLERIIAIKDGRIDVP